MNTRIARICFILGYVTLVSACGGAATSTPQQATVTAVSTEIVEPAGDETEEIEATEGDQQSNEEAAETSASPSDENITQETLPEGTTATINFPNANARSGPGTAYESLGALEVGTTMTVIARSEGSSIWYLVTLPDGELGWLWARVVNLNPADAEVEIAATIPPTPES
jgi:uncharacterized protein YgiM (DUF1202 family)